uniref:Uncharacterized protein n=1 Tax=uncultured Bacteroidota bacterium TaxID=152509 RepID=H5SG32_9BACT|nr:hypothetical protein HGMM_F23B02C57 [uncultured Bacteroidetes bacterium]
MRIVSLLAVEQKHPFGILEPELVLVESCNAQAHKSLVPWGKKLERIASEAVVQSECIGARTEWDKQLPSAEFNRAPAERQCRKCCRDSPDCA